MDRDPYGSVEPPPRVLTAAGVSRGLSGIDTVSRQQDRSSDIPSGMLLPAFRVFPVFRGEKTVPLPLFPPVQPRSSGQVLVNSTPSDCPPRPSPALAGLSRGLRFVFQKEFRRPVFAKRTQFPPRLATPANPRPAGLISMSATRRHPLKTNPIKAKLLPPRPPPSPLRRCPGAFGGRMSKEMLMPHKVTSCICLYIVTC